MPGLGSPNRPDRLTAVHGPPRGSGILDTLPSHSGLPAASFRLNSINFAHQLFDYLRSIHTILAAVNSATVFVIAATNLSVSMAASSPLIAGYPQKLVNKIHNHAMEAGPKIETRYSIHFLRQNLQAWDWGSRSVGQSWRTMAAVCDSPKQTLVAPALGSHFRLAQQAIVALERSVSAGWHKGRQQTCQSTSAMSAFGTKQTSRG